MQKTSTAKIVYVTDHDFVNPTLVSIWSLLATLRGAAELHIWGHGLTAADWEDVRRVSFTNPSVTLFTKNLDEDQLSEAHGPKDYISAATMGRLFIPRYIEGYALYIDGDTLITDDVTPLFNVDLKEAYAGVVRDFTLLHWLADENAALADRDTRLPEVANLMRPAKSEDYFNAGVILFNCDAIRQNHELSRNIEDVVSASACSHGDQDYLNMLFADKVVHLDTAWNSSWGRTKRHHSYFKKLGIPERGVCATTSRIIHYHGPQKPWRNKRYDVWSGKGRATFAYRRRLADFAAKFPDLVPK